MDIATCRDILWDITVDMSDDEVQELIFHCQKIAACVVDIAEKELSN